MPTPGPINSHCWRSLMEPWASLGYHSTGTETVRPSCSSTMSAPRVTRTFLAVAASIAVLEVLMPCLQEVRLVLPRETLDPSQFVRSKSVVVRLTNGKQPELRGLVLARDVNVHWLVPVTCKEEEPIRAAPQ